MVAKLSDGGVTESDLEGKTIAELKVICDDLGREYPSKVDKNTLRTLILDK